MPEFEVTDEHVEEALDWLSGHPSRDYLDAAFAIAAGVHSRSASTVGYSKWPEFVQRVRSAVERWPR